MEKILYEKSFMIEADKDNCIEIKTIRESIKALAMLGIEENKITIKAKIDIDLEDHNNQVPKEIGNNLYRKYRFDYIDSIELIGNKKVLVDGYEIKVNKDDSFTDFKGDFVK